MKAPTINEMRSLRRIAATGTAWFIVETVPNSERKAARELREAGLRVYVPKQFKRVRRRQKPGVRTLPLMAGYLLVRFTPGDQRDQAQLYAIAHACRAVKDVMSYEDRTGAMRPYPIPEKIVKDFGERQRRRAFGKPFVDTDSRATERQRAIFTPGRKVRVQSGLFTSLEAVIEQFAGLNSVKASVEGMGRATMVTFSSPEEELEPLGKAEKAA